MASNKKLTSVIQGRNLTGVENQAGSLKVHFDDGSVMTVKTSGSIAEPTSGAVKSVRQAGTRLDLDLADGRTLEIPLAEETSSVMLRDKNGALEYAD